MEMMILGRSPGAEADQLSVRNKRDAQDGITRFTDESGVPAGRWLVLVHGVKQDPIDQHYLEAHTAAAKAGWKLARVDYMREWKLCTRWLVFRAPIMAIVDGEDIRFLHHQQVLNLGKVLEDWKAIPVWSSSFAPSGQL